jgi:hypothetical protein
MNEMPIPKNAVYPEEKETPADPMLEERPVTFLREITKVIGFIAVPAEREFLISLAGYLDLSDWRDVDYKACAQLYSDYRNCLSDLGPRATQIGLRVSVASRLFQRPVDALRCSYIIPILLDIVSLEKGTR